MTVLVQALSRTVSDLVRVGQQARAAKQFSGLPGHVESACSEIDVTLATAPADVRARWSAFRARSVTLSPPARCINRIDEIKRLVDAIRLDLERASLSTSTIPIKSTTGARVVVMAALREELEPLLRTAWSWSERQSARGFSFWRGEMPGGETIVAATPDKMGLTRMAVACTQALIEWRPTYLALIGICGAPKKVKIGDLIVPKNTIHYLFGAFEDGKLKRQSMEEKTNEELVSRVQDIETAKRLLLTLWDDAKGMNRPEGAPHLRTDPMGSADLVVKDEEKVDEALAADRKMVAIEMESYAAACAAATFGVPLVVIKAVSDNADPLKTDAERFRHYVKSLSAGFLVKLIEEGLFRRDPP